MIKIEKNYILIIFTILFTLMNSCKDLDELNINPNGVDPDVADLNLLMPTFITNVGQNVVNLGFGDIAGVMQHTQKDGWTGSHNSYEWTNNSHSWGGYYGILRNVDEFHQKAVKNNYEFHEGVALVMKAYVFGLIADLWGDAPLTDALKADLGEEYFKPVFDPQKDIYLSILNDLKDANIFLSKDKAIYENISATQDVLYKGNVAKWRKFANSL
ncbi:MAG: SusD/RagB family nutrient-binding outer membrane lipoprotein, partial [Dysgonamonadaceae bacterium]|nr:SusD/RagB family nutrient-binding outer membrane lipoprotein [Dysgonamonadaceae bacterium]